MTLIGKTVTIKEAKNKTLIGKSGTVIDETENTIILHDTKDITIIKDQFTTLIIEDA